jgi:alpha-1,2-mannosyltransferase
MSIFFKFESEELPLLLNSTGLLPEPLLPPGVLPTVSNERKTAIDLTPIKHFNLTLCLGKEWYRFPSHFLVPDGVRVEFIRSEFRGLLPGHFGQSSAAEPNGTSPFSNIPWPRPETRYIPDGFNDLNQEEISRYVSLSLHREILLADVMLLRLWSQTAAT